MITRGRWLYHADLGDMPGSAWQLDGASEVPSDWWLRLRTGAGDSLRWCGYCWTPPYRWWMLYRGDPSSWVLTPLSYWRWRDAHTPQHGNCTHKPYLPEAMRIAERAYTVHIVNVLAG